MDLFEDNTSVVETTRKACEAKSSQEFRECLESILGEYLERIKYVQNNYSGLHDTIYHANNVFNNFLYKVVDQIVAYSDVLERFPRAVEIFHEYWATFITKMNGLTGRGPNSPLALNYLWGNLATQVDGFWHHFKNLLEEEKITVCLDFGCGRGFMANIFNSFILANKLNVKYVALDRLRFVRTLGKPLYYKNIQDGCVESVGDMASPNMLLILFWPSQGLSTAKEVLEQFTRKGGRHILYAGEHKNGSTGDDVFFESLEAQFEKVAEWKQLNLGGYEPYVEHWMRK